jgi:general stress protein 26
MKIDYNRLEAEIIAVFNHNKKWVLATAAANRVTARTISIVNLGLKVFFQTAQNFIKFQQLSVNPQVALCFANIQIEGTTQIKGHPLEPANEWFAREYQKHHPSAYARYLHLPNEVVIEVIPTVITLWKYIDDQPCRDFLLLKERIARREY